MTAEEQEQLCLAEEDKTSAIEVEEARHSVAGPSGETVEDLLSEIKTALQDIGSLLLLLLLAPRNQ